MPDGSTWPAPLRHHLDLEDEIAGHLAARMAADLSRASAPFRGEIVETALAQACADLLRHRFGPAAAAGAMVRAAGRLIGEAALAA